MTDHETGSPLTADLSGVLAVVFAGAPLNDVARALNELPPEKVAELRGQIAQVRALRERRTRPFGVPDWLFGPRETWLLRLLDHAEAVGIRQAVESAPELPPVGRMEEFRDLWLNLAQAPSRARIRKLFTSDPRTRRSELYDMAAFMESELSVTDPVEVVILKIRASWLLWVLQRSRIVGHDQALIEAPPLPVEASYPSDEPDLFRDWTTDSESPVRDAVALQQAGVEHLNRYRQIRDAAEFAAAVDLLARAISRFPQGHIGAAYTRGILAEVYLHRWRHEEDQQFAEEAASLLAQVTPELPADDQRWAGYMIRLGGLLILRFEWRGDVAALEEAIAVIDRICTEPRADLESWLTGINLRLHALVHEFAARIAAVRHLDTLLDLVSEAMEEARLRYGAFDRPTRTAEPGSTRRIANGLKWPRFRQSGRNRNSRSLPSAEGPAAGRPAVPATPKAGLAVQLTTIGQRCRDVHERSGDKRYLTAAIEVSRTALSLSPPGAEPRWGAAVVLSAALTELSHDEPDPALPGEALSLLADVASESPLDWPHRLELLQVQGAAAGMMFDMTAEPRWGEFGVSAGRAALALARQRGQDVPTCALALAAQLMSVHERTGNTAELDEAIGLCEEAAELAPPQQRTLALNSLGVVYGRRFGLMASITDIDASISALERAAQAAEPTAPEMRLVRINLSQAFSQRFLRTKDPAFIDRAVDCLEEALRHVSGQPANRAFLMAQLASTLRERSAFTGESADIERCLELCEDVLREEGNLHKRTTLFALMAYGSALVLRHLRGGPSSDLDRAIDALERTIPEARLDAANGPKCLCDLAHAYRQRHDLNSSDKDAEYGVACYKEAIEWGMNLSPAVALQAALQLGSWEADRGAWPEAAGSYQRGLKAVERLVATQAERTHKESWLRDAQMLPARAAYALACDGRLEEGVQALENGQTLLLNQALGQGGPDLARLHAEGHGALADRYEHLTAQVSGLWSTEPTLSKPALSEAALFASAARHPLTAHAEQLSSSLYDVIDEIKAGSDPALSPLSFREITDAASEKPLAYVTYSPWGGMVLLVDRTGTVRHIALPGLTDQALREQLVAYLSAYADSGAEAGRWRAAIDDAGRWLWNAVMEPLIAQGHLAVTIVPTGYLWLLPLHLAWRHDHSPSGRRYALDDALITFSPNARVLNRGARVGDLNRRSILIVENPDSSSGAPLRYAEDEARAALWFFADEHEHLKGPAATRARVLAALGQHDYLHFICHGRAVLGSPLDSGLLLSGSTLSLRDIMAARTAASLVVLSACETAVTGTTLPDEVVGLPAGFLQAGASGVVGSLWAVPDATTAALMALFYQSWRGRGEAPAHALRRAQQQLRDELVRTRGPVAAHPSLWGAFIYVGQ